MSINPLDFGLEDAELLEELNLVAELMIGARASEGHLSEREIDDLLGVRRGNLKQIPHQVKRDA